VHEDDPPMNAVVELLLKTTIPDAPSEDALSATVALHAVVLASVTLAGVQATVVVVGSTRASTAISSGPALSLMKSNCGLEGFESGARPIVRVV
jgi:hypothetical protein